MKESKNYKCPKCREVVDTTTETRIETYPVKGEETTIQATVRVCARCGEDLFDEKLDDANLQLAYDIYRRNHHIIGPQAIALMRENYNLSQRSLGALLGWGEISIHRYESGSLPDDSHNQVLKFIQDPVNMHKVFAENKERLPASAQRKLEKRLDEIMSGAIVDRIVEIASRPAKEKTPSHLTGYQKFNPERLMEMMIFFASKPNGVLKTKLNKLLWYSDFIHFREHAISISGSTYVHLPFGPVPDQYEIYLYSLAEDGSLALIEKDFGNGYVGENIEALREPEMESFTISAHEILEKVYQFFLSTSSKQISDLSHKEKAYLKTKKGEMISYDFAKQLSISL